MQQALDWLLGLKSLRPGDAGVQVGFAIDLPAWQWAAVGVACVALGAWSYRRIEGPLWVRGLLAGSRALLLVLLAVLVCGPRLQRPNETIEKDWVVVMVDRSGSMRIPDSPDPASPGTRVERDAQLRSILARNRAVFDRLAQERTVLWQGFDAGAYDLKPAAPDSSGGLPVALAEPVGARTDLGVSLEQALRRAAARPLSGVVLLTDGRTTDAPSRQLLRRLAAERIPVITVPLGSPDPIGDFAVRAATGPGVAFVDDVTPVEAIVEHVGAFGPRRAATVQLIDLATGDILDQRDVDWSPAPADAGTDPAAAATRRITLTATPANPGKAQWAVRVVPARDDAADLVDSNNQATLAIELVDRPLRVVYFDGYPRWEYRFLQAILTREKTLASTAMLLAPGRRYIQEGNTPMDALPISPGEWDDIDVIVIGDVQPEVFSGDQLRQIRQRVASGGAGLLWIAGEGATPSAWRGTVLSDLLPVNVETDEPIRFWDRDVVMKPTTVAERLGVLRLLRLPVDGSWWPEAVSDPRSGWSRLRWAQRLERTQLKPATETLATGESVLGDEVAPLVVSMRYGAGRVIYVATDETWRWRFGRGEDLPERFWLQLVRLLGRESVGRAGRPAILTATPSRSQLGQPVRVRAEILDQAAAEGAGNTLPVRIVRLGETGDQAASEATPDPAVEIVLRRAGGAAAAGSDGAAEPPGFVATWVPTRSGRYRLELVDPLLAGAAVATDAEVWLSDDELRRPETDHPLLERLSRDSEGKAIVDGDLSELDRLLPHREVRIALAPDEHTLWDTPLALILLLTLLTFEWVVRRLIRLA